MRVFIGLALIILLSFKIRADDDDDFATGLIDPAVIEYLESNKRFHTPAALSENIPNAGAFKKFFERLSENYMQAFKTLNNAQFFVSAIQPTDIDERFNKIVAAIDQTYQGEPFLGFVKLDVITAMNLLIGYGDEIAEFKLVPFINGTKFSTWISGHKNDFRGVGIGKNLADYLKHVNGLIGSIRKSIGRSHVKIQHAQLKKLGLKIFKTVMKFEILVDEALDGSNDVSLLSSSLDEIRNSIDELRTFNNGKCFNGMKDNARKILKDLNQLKLLMEKQWTDMDSIFCTKKLPQQLPSVNLVN